MEIKDGFVGINALQNTIQLTNNAPFATVQELLGHSPNTSFVFEALARVLRILSVHCDLKYICESCSLTA